ncbi:MAG TPA: hypothetical protein VGQ04_19570, partial [Chitinophagaceae bacterium]|nr:hypothetical protein [Chitinophagaceae bacterium]
MKRFVLTVFTFLPAFSVFSFAQNITGIWRGYFITDDGEQYRFEIQMEQSNNTLSGVTYSYQDKRFYGKCTMTGNYSNASGNALVQEIKTIEVKMSLASSACIQKCLLTYAKSGKEEFLEGTFSSVIEKNDSISGRKRGEDCGGGKMILRKVITSDFYVEPFLRKKNPPVNNNPPLVKTNPPVNNSTAKTVTKPPANNPTKNNSGNTSKSTVLVKPKIDTVKKVEVDPVRPEDKKDLTIKPNTKTQDLLRSRENNLIQTLLINSEDVTVKLYDNGEIDDDTISVYLDKKLVLSKKRLSAAALSINLKMDESNPEHELIMVADNLGRIPPNTSLMIVTAGEQRFEVRIT